MLQLTLTPFDHSSPKVILNNAAIDKLGLTNLNLISMHSGSSSADIEVVIGNEGNLISNSALEALNLPRNTKCQIINDLNIGLRTGPVIGILTSRNKRHRTPPYTSQGFLLRKFLHYCKDQHYIAFVFSPDGVDQENQTITGYYLESGTDGKDQWKKHLFPLPDVIYDRVLHRSYEKKRSTIQVKDYLIKGQKIPYFNPKFLNKWETHRILQKDNFLNSHLPETTAYKGQQQLLLQFLRKYNTVYIKPVHGSLGVGIIKVTRSDDGFLCQQRRNRKNNTDYYKNFDELFVVVNKHISNKSYIIQRGLNMLKYKDLVFDIRVLMQKDGSGKWSTTATVARLAQEGSIFPNIAAGGEAKNMAAVWKDFSNSDWYTSETYKTIEKVSLRAAEVLENELGGFGEIGLDIGIDVDGNIWIVEINSKPSRKVFSKDQLSLKTKSIELPMDYASYLAGFNPTTELGEN